ncbi:MAG TPA: PAS domain-containing protein, partial [Stellaceae bacterium]
MPLLLQEVLAYWRERAADRRAPVWRDVDPFSDLPEIAPSIVLWQTAGDEHDYVCMRAGAAVCEIAGRDLHGVTLGEMCWDNVQAVRQEFDGVAETLLAHYVERSIGGGRQKGRSYSRLLLPVSDDGRSASVLWGTLVLL